MKAFVSKLNGLTILQVSANWFHWACRFYYYEKCQAMELLSCVKI